MNGKKAKSISRAISRDFGFYNNIKILMKKENEK